MDQDTAFPPFKISAQHWKVTYKPSTNKQRRSLAGEGERKKRGKETSDPSPARKYREPTESRAVLRPQEKRIHAYDYFHSTKERGK